MQRFFCADNDYATRALYLPRPFLVIQIQGFPALNWRGTETAAAHIFNAPSLPFHLDTFLEIFTNGDRFLNCDRPFQFGFISSSHAACTFHNSFLSSYLRYLSALSYGVVPAPDILVKEGLYENVIWNLVKFSTMTSYYTSVLAYCIYDFYLQFAGGSEPVISTMGLMLQVRLISGQSYPISYNCC